MIEECISLKKISTQVTPGKFVAICKLLENNAEKA